MMLNEIDRTETGTGAQLCGTSRTILVADDDRAVRTFLCRALESLGYRVLSAVDGRDAVRLFLDYVYDIDLLVTDFDMPGINGLELASAVVRVRPDMKVLITSGNTDETKFAKCPWPRLNKPFRIDQLSDSVAAVF